MKILIADFDKTLFNDNYKENVDVINKFVDEGNVFIIATGRNLSSLRLDLNPELNFSYIVCNNGGIIFDRTFNVVYRKDISDEVTLPIYNKIKRCPYVGNPLIDVSTRYEDDVCDECNAIVARIIDREKTKILLDEILDEFPVITGYLSDRWLNIDDQSVSKGNALKYICNLLNHDYKDAYAIGDNLNDLSMCEICNGFALSEGSDELKAVSKGIVNDITELIEML